MGEGETANNGGTTSPNSSETDGLIIAPIQVVIPGMESDSEEEEVRVVKKPKKKSKKKSNKAKTDEAKEKMDKTMLLTKTFGQALRLINEQREREKQKAREEEIRKMALEQKARREQGGRAQVRIHI